MTTLVTGATGFVGSAVARALAAQGHDLRCLVRANSDRRNLTGLKADIVVGDLTDHESLSRAVVGCQYLVHVAADYRIWVPDPDAMLNANVNGAVAIIRAAAAAGVEKIVHCSSVATLGQIGDGTPATETTPTDEADFVGIYKRSKYLAEKAVLDLVKSENLPVVVVNPAAPVGPRDIKPTPTGKMILDAAAGRMPVYLDHNATTPIRPEAAEAMTRALSAVGNPSAIHGYGRAARRIVEDAREQVAVLVGADPAGVIFTSGGTEANALALAGLGRPRVLASAIEHPSVLRAAAEIEQIPVDWRGVVELDALDKMLEQNDEPALVSLMLVNNETGVVQPVAQAAHIAHEYGAFIHCDAVQAAGRVEIDMDALEVDALSLSAHKLGGPMGVGALVLADARDEIIPLLHGGAQEGRRRAGTENVAGIAGFGAAVAVARQGMVGDMATLARLRDGLEHRVRARVPSVNVFGDRARRRVANTSCFAVPGIDARKLVIALDLEGVAVSAGAACSSGRIDPSHVLAAMGAGPLASSAIRVSLGWTSGEADIDAFCEAFFEAVGRLGGAVAAAA